MGSLLVTAPHTDVVGTLKMSVGVSRDCRERERERDVWKRWGNKISSVWDGWLLHFVHWLLFLVVCFLTSLMVMCVCRCSKKITLKESIQWKRTIVPYVTLTTVFPSEEEMYRLIWIADIYISIYTERETHTHTYTDWSTLKQKSAMLLFDGICNVTVDVYVRRKHS